MMELTLEQRVERLEQQVVELAWYISQTRFACDCLLQIVTRGQLQRIPWEDMDPPRVEESLRPPAEHVHVPNRAERRRAARDFINRVNSEGK